MFSFHHFFVYTFPIRDAIWLRNAHALPDCADVNLMKPLRGCGGERRADPRSFHRHIRVQAAAATASAKKTAETFQAPVASWCCVLSHIASSQSASKQASRAAPPSPLPRATRSLPWRSIWGGVKKVRTSLSDRAKSRRQESGIERGSI